MPKPRLVLRTADIGHAGRLHALICANVVEGHLLPRQRDDVAAHAPRFTVALRGRKVIGCAELAPLGDDVAEVRSLSVAQGERGNGVGRRIVEELRGRARREGFARLCAFTHVPGYFAQMGFSIVPHLWVAEKVFTDCVKCPQFRRCGQYAMVLPLDTAQPAEIRMLPMAAAAGA